MKMYIISLVTLLSAPHLFAAPSCLSSVSDNELLTEVQHRMSNNGGGRPTNSGLILDVSCSNNYLYVRLNNVESGNQKQVSSDHIGSQCQDLAASLQHLSGAELTKPLVISTCSNSYLNKYSINMRGETKQISSDHQGSNCMTLAIDFNKRQRP